MPFFVSMTSQHLDLAGKGKIAGSKCNPSPSASSRAVGGVITAIRLDQTIS